MNADSHDIPILVADDDQDDCLMTRDAFAQAGCTNPLQFVHDGEELMDYLNRQGRFADADRFPTPGLVLLDLNMPRKDGREALREIKADPALRMIPVVVLTTSKAEEDVARSYDEGVNSFISKPASFSALIEVVQSLGKYWLQTVDLPPSDDGGGA